MINKQPRPTILICHVAQTTDLLKALRSRFLSIFPFPLLLKQRLHRRPLRSLAMDHDVINAGDNGGVPSPRPFHKAKAELAASKLFMREVIFVFLFLISVWLFWMLFSSSNAPVVSGLISSNGSFDGLPNNTSLPEIRFVHRRLEIYLLPRLKNYSNASGEVRFMSL